MKKLLIAFLMALSFLGVNAQTVVTYKNSESTLNGQNFFVKGMYCSRGVNLSKVKDLGVNVVMNYATKQMSVTEAIAFLDDAARNDLYVLFQFSAIKVKDVDVAYVKTMTNALRNHNALYGWYLFDEPSLHDLSPADLKKSYNAIKSLDSNHPVFVANWKIEEYHSTCDVDMRQFYQGRSSAMQRLFDDGNGNGYLHVAKRLDINWLPIVNTHSAWKKYGDVGLDKIMFPSTAPWYAGVTKGSDEYNKLQNRAKDLNNFVSNPFGKKDRYGMEFLKSANFPDSKDRIRGQVACAFVNNGNCIYWWLFNEGNTINKRYGWYTTFHYEETKNSHKEIVSEIDQFSDILLSDKMIDEQYVKRGCRYRYIKGEDGRELVILSENTGSEKFMTIDLPPNSADRFTNLSDGKTYDIKNSVITIPANGGVFLLSNPVTTSVHNVKDDQVVIGKNYPNPFKFETMIPIKMHSNGNVNINIFDHVGRLVCQLVNDCYDSGKHEFKWNGTTNSGKKVIPGTYVCVITANGETETLKISVVE